jgi:hypothetical protein
MWTNDGSLSSAYQFTSLKIEQLLDALFFFPMHSSLLMGLTFVVFSAVAVIAVLFLVLRRSNKNEYGFNLCADSFWVC